MIKIILLSLAVLGVVFSPAHTFAQDLSSGKGASILTDGNLIPECLRASDDEKEDVTSRTVSGSCVTDSILFYTNILLLVVAIGAFLYMLYGAFLYATAFGEDSKIGQAKKTVTHAIIGIVIAGLSVLVVELLRSALGA